MTKTTDKKRNQGYFNRETTKKMLWRYLWIGCLLSLGLEFFVHRKSHFGAQGIDGMFGFFAVLGFASCLLFILLAKLLGLVVKKSEDYYDA
ncbi:MAG: hypothetical protein VW378_05645 [bacterium]